MVYIYAEIWGVWFNLMKWYVFFWHSTVLKLYKERSNFQNVEILFLIESFSFVALRLFLSKLKRNESFCQINILASICIKDFSILCLEHKINHSNFIIGVIICFLENYEYTVFRISSSIEDIFKYLRILTNI